MSFAFATVIRFTIVLLGAGITTLTLKRSSAAIRCALWTVALLCGFLVPMTDILLPQQARLNLPVFPVKETESVIVKTVVLQTTAIPSDLPPCKRRPSNTSGSRLSDWLEFAWALGFVYSMARPDRGIAIRDETGATGAANVRFRMESAHDGTAGPFVHPTTD